jgi:outer membrane protein assembly factor BamB
VEAATGKEVWKDEYKSGPATPPAQSFSGPRASPAVAEGKVVTFGTRGILTCYDAASGKQLWRKDDFKGSWPPFFTSSSPLIVDGVCIVQLGGKEGGKFKGGKDHSAIVAYDLATGAEKWKWAQEAADYASPVLATLNGTKVIIAETDKSIVALNTSDGALLWKAPYAPPPKGYNAATPIVEGSTVVFTGSGRGVKAIAINLQGGKIESKEVWSNTENSVQYNTPILKDGLIFGITNRDQLFCVDTRTQKTAWVAPIKGNRGYGSVVDAGSVLFALTPAGTLTVFEPNPQEFKTIATYKVADKGTYAYPVISGKRIFVKDQNNLTLFTIE